MPKGFVQKLYAKHTESIHCSDYKEPQNFIPYGFLYIRYTNCLRQLYIITFPKTLSLQILTLLVQNLIYNVAFRPNLRCLTLSEKEINKIPEMRDKINKVET